MARHRAEHHPDVASEADAPDRDPQDATDKPDEPAGPGTTGDARGDGPTVGDDRATEGPAGDETGNDAGAAGRDAGTDEDDATVDGDADDSAEDDSADGDAADGDAADGEDAEPARERGAEADEFWQRVNVEPIEVALPAGVGYTLRAYRAPDELDAVDGEQPVRDDAEPADDEPADERDTHGGKPRGRRGNDDSDDDSENGSEVEDAEDDADDEDTDHRDAEDEDEERDSDEDDSDEDEESADAGPDEVPVFLSRQGRLLLFHTPEALAEFVRGDAPHALRGIAGYDELAEGVRAEYVVADEQDHYELDLVVSNLRGGHDAWEPRLIVSAGELSRDLGYALGLGAILTSLAPGSPLDDLDDAARAASNGGFRAFRARRRMRKIGAQQAALAWRTIIGKISAAVDWRE